MNQGFGKPFGRWFESSGCQLLYQRPGTERLASGAEAGASVLHRDPLDGAAANEAGFASFMGNLKIEMSCAQLALGTNVGIHTGAFAADGCLVLCEHWNRKIDRSLYFAHLWARL
jgi:hypothetical protein